MSLQIQASPRFLSAYQKASIILQGLTEGCVYDFVRRWRSDRKTVLQRYDKLKGFGQYRILEIDIAGAHRLLAKYTTDKLILLEMGGHEVVGDYSLKKYNLDINNPAIAPKQFWPEHRSELFLSLPDQSANLKYEQEISPEWLFFLEEEQYEILFDIASSIENTERSVHFIIGGPETGKTCILLNLFKLFVDSEYRIGISISDNLTEYIEQSMCMSLADFRVHPLQTNEVDILLVDDPDSLYGFNTRPHVVAAFDPLQLSSDITDENLQKTVDDLSAKLYWLDKCYRQKKNVGVQTKKIVDTIATSTPFLAREKIQDFRNERKTITASANELEFINPHGYVQKYPSATIEDVQSEVSRILRSKQFFWKHAPSILILPIDCELPEYLNQALSPLRKKGRFAEPEFNKIFEIKGLEFQHVLIFISQSLYSQLDRGFKGSGKKDYNQRRLLRIPFSRAKDSVAVFCLDE